MKVCILGCGPTGLLAAHACVQHGITPEIYSKKRKSQLYGSQYLHEPIDGIIAEDEGEQVKYVNIGTPEEYRRKTHGKYWDGIVAPEDFETEHMAWNIREAYDRLWRAYGPMVKDYEIPTRLWENGKTNYTQRHPYWRVLDDIEASRFDLVISTVPRRIWETKGEQFVYSLGWALGDAPEAGLFVPFEIADMHIVCDGSDATLYNRLSNVFGYKTVEWPAHVDSKYIVDTTGGVQVSRITKPLMYVPAELDVNPANNERWLHVGRFGEWRKGVVTTDAYHDVVKKLIEMEEM